MYSDETLAAFVDLEDAKLVTTDRSTLERFSVCPAQALFVESGLTNNNSFLAATGEEIHSAFGKAISDYINDDGSYSPGDLAERAGYYLKHSRPDVQPEVIKASRAMVWDWSKLIASMHPANILRYDGGESDYSGQLSWDLKDLGIRVTSELDLLFAGPSKQLLHEADYKTGYKIHSSTSVRDSFQFQVHAWLVLNNYPDVEGLEVRVWNTRARRLSFGVEFERKDLGTFDSRIRMTAETMLKHRGILPTMAETWPTVEKCGFCPAAASCPVSGQSTRLIEDNPGLFVDQLVAAEARVTAMRKMASQYVSKTGKDIVSEAGNAFGTGKPKTARAPAKATYSVEATEDDTETESE